MVKAATGTGAAGALGDREEIKKNFDPSLDKAQLRANINAVQVLVGGALVNTLHRLVESVEVNRRMAGDVEAGALLREAQQRATAQAAALPWHRAF
jgi:hypothetical protein